MQSKRIINDVVIKVGKVILPTKFIVLDYYVYDWVPIILWNTLLEIGEAYINMGERNLIMKLNDEEMVFKVYISLKSKLIL